MGASVKAHNLLQLAVQLKRRTAGADMNQGFKL